MKRQLDQCSHAKVRDKLIICEMGHKLYNTRSGGLWVGFVAKGQQLALGACQDCKDFDSMGDPLPEWERGWLKK